jgi:hypothetical protein
MTDLPKGDSFHNYEVPTEQEWLGNGCESTHGNPFRYCVCGWIEEPEPEPTVATFHAYVKTKDLNDGVKFASRLALDRARRENHNPRQGTLTITFDDDGVNALWRKHS